MRTPAPHTSRNAASRATLVRYPFAVAIVAAAAMASSPTVAATGQEDDADASACASGIGLGDARIAIGEQYRVVTLQAGYEQPLAERWTGFLAAGWLRSDAPNPASGSRAIGTELLAETRWQVGPLMALEIGAGVLMTGDFFRTAAAAGKPATLYELYTRWQLEF